MFTGELLPYQRDAVEQMATRRNALVAYDLGLGKTVIALAAIERIRDAGEINKPVLVVALASLKYQWASAIAKFTDRSPLVIDGTKNTRTNQLRKVVNHEFNKIDYVIMNYEAVVNDWSFVDDLDLDAIVMDEATAIKGFRSKRAKKVKDLARRTPVRFALTGTPVENGKPEEVFSIMQAVDGRILGRFDHFEAAHIVRNHWGGVQRYTNLDHLHKKLSRVLLRKTQRDPDVAPHLPDTIHRDPLLVPMDKKVRRLYDSVATDLLDLLEEAVGSYGRSWSMEAHYGVSSSSGPPDEVMGPLMSRLMILRQLASDPGLVLESAENFRKQLDGTSARAAGSPTAYELVTSMADAEEVLQGGVNRKLDLLAKIIGEHLDTDDDAKVVVFTSFRLTATKILERFGDAAVEYSGGMNALQKEAAKERFQTDPDVRVFVSTDAGGYGVDLPQANLLVNFDLPWSSGTAVQRNGRIRRASSRWPTVVIQDLLVEKTVEIRQHQMLQQKLTVATAVIDGEGIDQGGGVGTGAGSFLDHLRESVRPPV